MIKSVSGSIVVKLEPQETVTPGGILLPENYVGEPGRKATVVYRRDGSQFYVGEVVLIDPYLGVTFDDGGEQFHIIKETDVYGTIEE